MLSVLERKIVKSIASGQHNSEVAEQLRVSETAVQEHLQIIMDKLNVSSRVELILFAYSTPTGKNKAA